MKAIRVDRRSLLLLGSAGALVSCVGSGAKTRLLASNSEVLELPISTPELSAASVASTAIGWKILKVSFEGGNAVISPSSLVSGLAMVAEGATGVTKETIDELFTISGDERSAAIGALRQALAEYDSLPDSVDANNPPDKPVVHIASRALLVDDTTCKQEFLDRIKKYYDAAAEQAEYGNLKPALDQWTNKHTAGLIKKSAIIPNESIRLVLQDALLFAAKWQKQFETDSAELDFHTEDGTVKTSTLSAEIDCKYTKTDQMQAVRLNYDQNLAMDVILPTARNPLDLTAELLSDCDQKLAKATKKSVQVVMPPCDLTAKLDLKENLETLGVNLDHFDGIFNDAAIDQAVQQVKLIVTAKGTVGAALTEIAVQEMSAPVEEPIRFIVDRPYLMRVLDTRTGWPLFLAVVTNPKASS